MGMVAVAQASTENTEPSTPEITAPFLFMSPSCVVIQTFLGWRYAVPIKSELIFWIRVWHLILAIIPPPLAAFPDILNRYDSLRLHLIPYSCDIRPDSQHVFPSHFA